MMDGAGKVKIVDISKWQGNQIDWDELAKGVPGVIIRATYHTTKDEHFEEFYHEAHRRGLKVGAYGYATWTGAGGKADISAHYEATALIKACEGKALDLGIWYDIEFEPGITNKAPGVITDIALDVLESLFEARPSDIIGLYGSLSFFRKYYIASKIKDVPKWVAAYGTAKLQDQVEAMDPYIWQYSGSGNLPGCKVKIDLDWLYTTKFPCFSPEAQAQAETRKYLKKIREDIDYYRNRFDFMASNLDDKYTPTKEEELAEEIFNQLIQLHTEVSLRLPGRSEEMKAALIAMGACREDQEEEPMVYGDMDSIL